MTKFKGKEIRTWADGFGLWHAELAVPSSGTGLFSENIGAAARRAIKAELIPRSAPGAKIGIRIMFVSSTPQEDGSYLMEYKERV